MEQTKAIEDLNKSRDKLEKMTEKAEKKLMSVKSELYSTEHEAKEDKERARNMIEVVTSEMKTLKKSLEEAEKREKQVRRNLVVKSCLENIGQFKSLKNYSYISSKTIYKSFYTISVYQPALSHLFGTEITIMICSAKNNNSCVHGMNCRKEKDVLIKAAESL